jgi:hypothetical protein
VPLNTEMPSIMPERLVMHRHRHSCWLSADGKVFDATLFLARHPAGVLAMRVYNRVGSAGVKGERWSRLRFSVCFECF